MKLYYCKGTCSRAPHIVLEELGIPFELHEINLKKGEGKTPEYRKINPTGAVPVLELGPNDYLREVQVILQYLADQHPDRKLAPPAGTRERYEMLQWLSLIATDVHKSFWPLFFAARITQDPKAQEAIVRTHAEQRLAPRWQALSEQLGDKDYLLGEYSIVDPYLYTTLVWAKLTKQSLPANLEAFMKRMEARPAVQRVLAREDARVSA